MPERPENPGARREFRGTGLYWSLFLALICGVAILIGIIQNAQSVELKYLGWDLRTPMIVVLLITVFASIVLTALVGVGWRHRRRRQLTEREELRGLRSRVGEPTPTSTAASTVRESSPPPPTVESAPPSGSPT
ncbi:MAG: LapA family protein [Candidatus Dormibacter sp.]